jgi:prepilin-type N-terminal cleavage/methylation domain-containing protein
LIELMIVVAIIGILAAVAFQGTANATTGAIGIIASGTFPSMAVVLTLPDYADLTAATRIISA